METKAGMIQFLHEAGYTNKAIATAVGVSATAILQWERGGVCRDPKAFARLRKLYVKVCDELGVKHD